MKQRTITSVLIIAVALVLVIFSSYICYPIALSVLSVISVFEMLRVMAAHKSPALSIPAFVIAAAFPTLSYFVNSDTIMPFLLIFAASMLVYLMWLLGVSIFSKGKILFSRVSEVFTSVIYVTISFTSLSLMRYIDRACGVFFVILVFVIAWVSDTSAFAVGSLMGKHKLIPEISPKKTVEGSVGGIIFSALACLVYGFGLDLILKDMAVNYIALFIFGLVLSAVSQLGDLVASLLKREYGAKDYGSIFPGHGGVMDRFDSVLSVSSILFILCMVIPPFTMG